MAQLQPNQPVTVESSQSSESVAVERLRNEFYEENWVWDSSSKSEHVLLSGNQRAAYFYTDPLLESTGTAGVRGSKGFQDGEHYWEVTFLEPPCGTSVMVGVGTRGATLSTDDYNFVDLIGRDEHSWGLSYKGNKWHKGECTRYCDPFYEQSTVIGVHLNLYTGTITFYKDGRSLGVAFKGIVVGGDCEFFPMACSTSAETEVEVGVQTCRYLSLHDKCCFIVAQRVEKTNIITLPLPNILKKHIHKIKSDSNDDL